MVARVDDAGRGLGRASGRRIIAGLLLGIGALALVVFTALRYTGVAAAIMAASLAMFAFCAWSARVLFGAPGAARFILIAVPIGWFAEQMGSSRGWFFGRYTYTDVLGPALGNVPLVIPLMWFALCHVGYVMANLMLWQRPVDEIGRPGRIALGALLAAMVVTAFDLGADPYFVFVLKAWIMQKTDGGWFGETLQGFVGWMFIGGLILVLFRLALRWPARTPITPETSRAVAVPLVIYASGLVFQLLFGHPIETRAIAVFAMGIPLLVSVASWQAWRRSASAIGGAP